MSKAKSAKRYTFSPAVESADDLESALSKQTEVYHRSHRNADGTPQRWRLNGAVKRWKRDRERISIPLKHGMYDYGSIGSVRKFNDCLALSYTEAEA